MPKLAFVGISQKLLRGDCLDFDLGTPQAMDFYPSLTLTSICRVFYPSAHAQVDTDFLKGSALGSLMEEYASQEDPEDEPVPEAKPDAEPEADDLEAMGMMVPMRDDLEAAMSEIMQEEPYPRSQEESQVDEGLGFELVDMEDMIQGQDLVDEVDMSVHFDVDGNLSCGPGLDHIEHVTKDNSKKKEVQYMFSPAWQYLLHRGLEKVPDIKGCGLCYNRLLGQRCST